MAGILAISARIANAFDRGMGVPTHESAPCACKNDLWAWRNIAVRIMLCLK
jgi:hypothetical protein